MDGVRKASECQIHFTVHWDVWESLGAKMISDDLCFVVVHPVIRAAAASGASAVPGKRKMRRGLAVGSSDPNSRRNVRTDRMCRVIWLKDEGSDCDGS